MYDILKRKKNDGNTEQLEKIFNYLEQYSKAIIYDQFDGNGNAFKGTRPVVANFVEFVDNAAQFVIDVRASGMATTGHGSDDEMFLTAKEVETALCARMKPGNPLEMHIFSGMKGIVVFKGTIIKCEEGRLEVQVVAYEYSIQRRSDCKIPEEGEYSVYCVTMDKDIKITLRDISAGGIGFFTDEQNQDILAKETEYDITFNFVNPPLNLSFALKWHRTLVAGKVHCGAGFINKKDKDDAILRKYIFSQQEQTLKKERERKRF